MTWCRRPDSNRQPTAYETAALTIELPRHVGVFILAPRRGRCNFPRRLGGEVGKGAYFRRPRGGTASPARRALDSPIAMACRGVPELREVPPEALRDLGERRLGSEAERRAALEETGGAIRATLARAKARGVPERDLPLARMGPRAGNRRAGANPLPAAGKGSRAASAHALAAGSRDPGARQSEPRDAAPVDAPGAPPARTLAVRARARYARRARRRQRATAISARSPSAPVAPQLPQA